MKHAKGAPVFTEADIRRHAARTGVALPPGFVRNAVEKAKYFGVDAVKRAIEASDRMNKTEREFSRILEAQKGMGEIVEWRYEGLTLAWGADPATGKVMRYTPDFVVWRNNATLPKGDMPWALLLIEVKGAHIYSRDLVRFNGCRACWRKFAFEMHQKKGGTWNRIH